MCDDVEIIGRGDRAYQRHGDVRPAALGGNILTLQDYYAFHVDDIIG